MMFARPTRENTPPERAFYLPLVIYLALCAVVSRFVDLREPGTSFVFISVAAVMGLLLQAALYIALWKEKSWDAEGLYTSSFIVIDQATSLIVALALYRQNQIEFAIGWFMLGIFFSYWPRKKDWNDQPDTIWIFNGKDVIFLLLYLGAMVIYLASTWVSISNAGTTLAVSYLIVVPASFAISLLMAGKWKWHATVLSSGGITLHMLVPMIVITLVLWGTTWQDHILALLMLASQILVLSPGNYAQMEEDFLYG